jgi:hypothetical protein
MDATFSLSHNPAACLNCIAMEQEIARLRALLISPGWGIPIAGETLDQLRVVARGATEEAQHVDAFVGDWDYLKQWNIAAGSQERTNSWARPALTSRPGDGLFRGQVDGADMFMFVFPAGQGEIGMANIKARLAEADITEAERRRFAQAVCRRSLGPFVGDVRYWMHRLGWTIKASLHPTITTRAFLGVHVSELENIFYNGDATVFEAKLARGVGR